MSSIQTQPVIYNALNQASKRKFTNSEAPNGPELRLKFNRHKNYQRNLHNEMLAMPKPDYHGKDFFQRREFRGLLLADYQEAIGEKAFKCVDQLNSDTVS